MDAFIRPTSLPATATHRRGRGGRSRRLASFFKPPRINIRSGVRALALSIAVSGALLAPGSGGTPVAVASPIANPAAFVCEGGLGRAYTVPDGYTQLFVQAGGAEGGSTGTPGGKGGSVQAVVQIVPGETVLVTVGCRGGDGNSSHAGGGGIGYGNGGSGGSSPLGQDGAGGGGASSVTSSGVGLLYVVAGAGGGGGGDATIDFGHDGGRGGDGSQYGERGHDGGGTGNPGGAGGAAATADGEKGWGTAAGGAGGGGGGGYAGGKAGHGGGDGYSGGGGGGGGSSFVRGDGTNVVYTRGNVTGDGYVVLVPMKPWSTLPSAQVFPCNNGAGATFTVPDHAPNVLVSAHGGGGSAGGASVQATVPVIANTVLTGIGGCSGSAGGKGYGNGGTGGPSQSSKQADHRGSNGGGGSALLDPSGKPLVVAGGGGGNGGNGAFTSGGNGGAGSQYGENGTDGSGAGSLPGSGGAGGGLSTTPNAPNGEQGSKSADGGGGGGGGGGYNGGHGGGSGDLGTGGGGGGGGSSFVVATASDVIYQTGVSRGNGYVVVAAVPASVPDPPTITLVKGGINQATVTFQPPAADGGEEITSYTVTANPGGVTASSTGSPITLTGLTATAPYSFTVRATNVVGSSPASASYGGVICYTVPDAPTISSVTPGDRQATVAFTPRGTGGQPITSYTAVARTSPTSTGPGITASATSSPISLTGLTNGTSYYVTVYATNFAGNGGESGAFPVLPATLPSEPTDVAATVVQGGISVSFSPPVSTGGLPIQSYTVSSTDGTLTATSTTSPVLMTGMTNGLVYVFTVHATTQFGTGPESAPTIPIHWTSSTALSPPLNVSAAASNGFAVVSFHAPLDDGGSPVLSYTVTSNPGGITASGGASPITVNGLTNGVTYTFTVVAVNANGSSQPSSPSNPVTPMPPTVPSQEPAPVASARNQGALVTVNPPLVSGGSPITSYTITSSPDGITATGAASPITITGLTNGVNYTFTAVATNAVGDSQASPVSNTITPSASLAPANDNFANAQLVSGGSASLTGTNVNATTETGEPGPGGASVWYAWTVPQGGVYQFDTCGSSFSPSVILYTGTTLNTLTPVPSGTIGIFCGATGTTISGLQVNVPSGGTIYIAVDGGTPTNTTTGNFNLHWGQSG